MSARQLHADLRSRRDTLRQVLDLSRLQLQVIDSNDYDSLWRIQQQKQALLATIQSENAHSPALGDRWKALRDSLPAEEKTQCESLISEADACLRDLLDEEAVSTSALERRLEETRTQLQTISQGQRSRRLHRLPPSTGKLMDVQT